MPLVDMALAFLAFALAYVVRYNLQIIRPVDEAFRAPFEPYLPFVLIYLVWINLIYRAAVSTASFVGGHGWTRSTPSPTASPTPSSSSLPSASSFSRRSSAD